ncbi:MAG: hypothetical protein FWG68_08165 [Defluviitaleaceae bacterium]|nr:hypothetical protein [Defluviitaleaceae bacterium]
MQPPTYTEENSGQWDFVTGNTATEGYICVQIAICKKWATETVAHL